MWVLRCSKSSQNFFRGWRIDASVCQKLSSLSEPVWACMSLYEPVWACMSLDKPLRACTSHCKGVFTCEAEERFPYQKHGYSKISHDFRLLLWLLRYMHHGSFASIQISFSALANCVLLPCHQKVKKTRPIGSHANLVRDQIIVRGFGFFMLARTYPRMMTLNCRRFEMSLVWFIMSWGCKNS